MNGIGTLWSEIAEFEKGEQKLKLNPLQWEARISARMEAYVKLMDQIISINTPDTNDEL